MNQNLEEDQICAPDPSAVFACALSLWNAWRKHARADTKMNISESYNGMDQFMREVMRVGTEFEAWSCVHVSFEDLDEVWPYLLQGNFGEACWSLMTPDGLSAFGAEDCLRTALHLRLPVKLSAQLPVPVDVTAINPIPGSSYKEFRIQTVRRLIEDDVHIPFTADDEPFDEEFEQPFFCLYGIGGDGLPEHIADRNSYSDALSLARKLAPGIIFPDSPTLRYAPIAPANA